MADDHRYSWLDDKAVERLLRGEPVEGQHGSPDDRNDRPHAEAERLAAVLSAVAEAARLADGAAADGTAPLPGEEAAVAAFRAAHAKPAVVPHSAEGQVGDKSTRIARAASEAPSAAGAPAAGGWRTGWRGRRPLRAGMVAAVAGCALSGFAVAAAAGVLPFGHSDGNPRPGSSVSDTGPGSGESARPEISEGGGTSTAPDGADGRTSDGTQGRGVPGGGEGHGKRDDRGKGEKGSGAWNNGKGGQRALVVCRRYLASEAGTGPDVGQKALTKLTRAAGSRSGIHDYCARLVGDGTAPRNGGDDTGSTGSTNGTGGTGSTNGTGGGSNGNGDGSGSGDDGGGSSKPAPPPPSETSSGSDGSTPSPDPTTSGTPAKELSDTPDGTPDGSPSGSPSTTPSGTPSGTASAGQSDPAKTAEPNAS